MSAKTRPATNPFFVENTEIRKKTIFRTKMFILTADDENGDVAKYETFMQSLYPFNMDSEFELNPMTTPNPSKSWTKEGNMLVHIEYLEFVDDLPSKIMSEVTGAVTEIFKNEDGSLSVMIDHVPHDVHAGLPLKVKIGQAISVGETIAGSDTPISDEREY